MTSPEAYTRFRVTYQSVALEQPLTMGEGDSLDNDIVLSDTENYLVLPVTSEQYTKLLSSSINGANRFFPDEYLEVIYPLIKAGKIMFCEKVADCIENDESVRSALSQWMQDNGYGVPVDGVDTIVGSDNTSNSDNLLTSCTENDLMGQCVALVEELNRIAVDWIQGMVAFTLPAEFAGYLAQSNPLASQLGIDYGDLVDWMSDEVLSQYEGAYDTALRNEAACLLFALCCEDCTLTLDDVISAFTGEVSIGLNPSDTWRQLIQDIVTLSVADQIVYGVWSLITGTWKIGSMFTGISGIQAFKFAIAQYSAVSPATIGCDPCLSCTSHDYKLSVGNVFAVSSNASYIAANGWRSVDVGDTVRYTIGYDFGSVINLSYFSARFKSSAFTYSLISNEFRVNTTWNNTGAQTLGIANWLGTQDITIEVNLVPVNTRYIYFFFDVYGAANGYVQLDESCVEFS